MTKGIIICRCYECHQKKSFMDIEVAKAPEQMEPEKKKNFDEYIGWLGVHGGHLGYILIQKINSDADVKKIIDEIKSWA